MSKLIKSKVLMREAKTDLEHGSYNKAVSASYFAVRLLVEHLIPGLKTTKDDKIANALYRAVEGRRGRKVAKSVKARYMELFAYRKMADHHDTLFSLEDSRKIVQMAETLMKEVTEILTD